MTYGNAANVDDWKDARLLPKRQPKAARSWEGPAASETTAYVCRTRRALREGHAFIVETGKDPFHNLREVRAHLWVPRVVVMDRGALRTWEDETARVVARRREERSGVSGGVS